MATRVSSSRFIGRETELAELEAALAEASDGKPSLAFVAGESGVGKSRLLDELLSRARGLGARTMGGESIELGEDELPYAPLASALRPLVRDSDPVLDSLPDPLRAELSRLVPELGASAPTPGDGEGASQRRLFEALLALLARLGEEAPVVLWLDDVHWADRSTRAFLGFLATSLCDERLVAVIAYRSDELHRRHPLRPLLAELERGPGVRRLELSRFDRDELATQLEDILGESAPPDVVARLYERSEGNALFTEELLAVGLDGRGTLPPTLRDALLVRVERLSGGARASLRVLSTAGRADHALLTEVSGLDTVELAEGLREAVAAHVVVVGDEDRYEFRHALLREAIYDDLLPGERSDLHQRLAEAFERRIASGDDGVWIKTGVAHHFHAAGDQPRALRAAIVAAEAAGSVDADGEAAALLDRALELWDRVDDPEAVAGLGHGQLLRRAGRFHERAGDDARAVAMFERALGELDPEREPERTAAALGALADAQWSLGLGDRARESLRRALELLPADEPTLERAILLMHHVRFLLLQGRFEEVKEAAPGALAAADAAQAPRVRSAVLHRLGATLITLGEVEEGTRVLAEAVETAKEAGSGEGLAAAYVNWADSLHQRGRSREAREIAIRGQSAAPRSYFPDRWLSLLRSEIAFALGEWDEAEAQLPQRASMFGGTSLVNANLRHAELSLGRGDIEAARVAVAEATALLAGAVEPQFIAVAGALGAELERRAGDIDAARAVADWAIDRIQYCSEDGLRMARVAAASVSVEADAAERARDVGDVAAERDALARAEMLAAQVEAAAEHDVRPVAVAHAATARAALSRAEGGADPAPFAEASARWAEVGWPYPRAVAMWRQAEAEVAVGDREAATRTAGEALALARGLGSAWLAEEVSGLAARARLRLDREPAGSDDEGPSPDADEDPFGLTPRERQVLALVAAGATNREIAAQLFMAEKTASVHVSRILGKLDVRSRTKAAAVAHRHGLAAVGADED